MTTSFSRPLKPEAMVEIDECGARELLEGAGVSLTDGRQRLPTVVDDGMCGPRSRACTKPVRPCLLAFTQ